MAELTLDPVQIELVKKTFQKVIDDPDTSIVMFYNRLFEIAPQIEPLFADVDVLRQTQKVFKILKVAIGSISQPHLLEPALHELGKRHTGYGVDTDMFVPMGEALLWMLEQRTGKLWSEEAREVWQMTYDFLAKTAIEAMEVA